MAFDLQVKSTPNGAKVSYGRLGDRVYETLPDKTDAIIKNRSYAIWYVTFELAKYKTKTIKYDPFLDNSHVAEAILEPE